MSSLTKTCEIVHNKKRDKYYFHNLEKRFHIIINSKPEDNIGVFKFSLRTVWLVSGKLPPMKLHPCKFSPGKFPLRKLSPGIFPASILIFLFFHLLWPLSLILLKRLICNSILFSWWEFFRGWGIFQGGSLMGGNFPSGNFPGGGFWLVSGILTQKIPTRNILTHEFK